MIATTVIRAVAAADGVDPADLDPLYEYINPDVLEQLSDQDTTKWSFTFQYRDHQVAENQGESPALQGGDESDNQLRKPPLDGMAGYSTLRNPHLQVGLST
ncbi:HalOD1 output domain-containing protein [Halomontanus rarus]|uniref:HalOD1 output domain-containing protein n=1 Tax=Halomontanus rarus TaxID=3034020 RepID=UPI0023E7FAC5|nr:HalOD1 output domain-containing protein [Halovivax sp. TS33]